MEIYSVSKVCVILFTRMLAKRLQGTGNDLLRCWITQQVNNWFLVHNLGVTVNCYHPGVVDTPAHDQPRSWANVVLWIPRRFFFKVSVFLTHVYLMCYKVICYRRRTKEHRRLCIWPHPMKLRISPGNISLTARYSSWNLGVSQTRYFSSSIGDQHLQTYARYGFGPTSVGQDRSYPYPKRLSCVNLWWKPL